MPIRLITPANLFHVGGPSAGTLRDAANQIVHILARFRVRLHARTASARNRLNQRELCGAGRPKRIAEAKGAMMRFTGIVRARAWKLLVSKVGRSRITALRNALVTHALSTGDTWFVRHGVRVAWSRIPDRL